MMFFFDYLYMQCCDLYRRDKSERASGSWRTSGMMMVGGSTAMLIGFISSLIFNIFFLENIKNDRELVLDIMLYFKILIVVLLFLCFLVFGIRYNKFISYEDVVGKARELSKTCRIILNILVIIYLLLAFPVFIIYAICVGPIV